MKLELLSTTVVVVAREHNPTILHPAFLAAQRIVPEDWELAEPPVCTPAFSATRYANGIAFFVESNRLMVTEEMPDGNPMNSRIPRLVAAYVEKLPHVRYKAVGVNFSACCLRKQPEQFLIERFLKGGAWNDETRSPRAFGARFVYQIEDTVLRLVFDAGQIHHQGKPESALLINGNYHSELPDVEPMKALRKLVGRWGERLEHFTRFSREILGMEESQ